MNIFLIRHGMTEGNMSKRYIGSTDQPLCDLGKDQIKTLASIIPNCDIVFTSPLIRCRQTAQILFPTQKAIIMQDLAECDFGVFEGKNATELEDDQAYIQWVNSFCMTPIPNGEDMLQFRKRSCDVFVNAVLGLTENHTVAFVTHGGCIMAILERLAYPKREFYDYHIDNGQYVQCHWEKEMLTIKGGAIC